MILPVPPQFWHEAAPTRVPTAAREHIVPTNSRQPLGQRDLRPIRRF